MLPDNSLSDPPVPSPFLPPRNVPATLKESLEMGGVALNDPSQGLMVQVWRAWAIDTDVYIESATHPASLLFSVANLITEVSLTFDQNMFPFVAFMENGRAKFRWYDTLIGAYTITTMDNGVRTPRCSIDDKRQFAVSASDIILGYIYDGNLCYRQQRDRYNIERVLYPDINAAVIDPRLDNVGMGTGLRFLFDVSGSFFPL